MDRITILNGYKYSIGFKGSKVDLYSLNQKVYPDLLNLDKTALKNAYQVRIWIRVRGCEALYLGVENGLIKLDVRPSKDVETLGAKEVDRGIYYAEVPVSEVERIWEERMPYLDFPFPEGLEKEKELDLKDL